MKISFENFDVFTPDDFQKVPLPFFKEWHEDLKSNPKQAKERLFDPFVNGYCCLGRLSLVQGRLKDGLDGDDSGGLGKDNPCFPVLSELGVFPKSCYVEKDGYQANAFSHCNDVLELTMLEIADVLNTLFKAE